MNDLDHPASPAPEPAAPTPETPPTDLIGRVLQPAVIRRIAIAGLFLFAVGLLFREANLAQHPVEGAEVGTRAVVEAALAESSDVPVFVTWSAGWCPQCRVLKKVIADLPAQYQGQMRFIEVDVDAEPNLSAEHSVELLPTQEIYFRGKPLHRYVGVQSRSLYEGLAKHYAGLAHQPMTACTVFNARRPC
jgi:thioredoxin 1